MFVPSNLPNGIVVGHDRNDSGPAGEANSWFESDDGVAVGWAEDGATSFSAE